MCKTAHFPLIWTRSKDIIVLLHLFRVASSVDLTYVALMQNLVRKLGDHARSIGKAIGMGCVVFVPSLSLLALYMLIIEILVILISDLRPLV